MPLVLVCLFIIFDLELVMSENVSVPKDKLERAIEESFIDGYKMGIDKGLEQFSHMLNKINDGKIKLSVPEVIALVEIAREESIKLFESDDE